MVFPWEAAEDYRGGGGGPSQGPSVHAELFWQPWHSVAAPPCSHCSALPLSFTKPSTSGPEPPLQPLTKPIGICLRRQHPNTFAICFKTGARMTLCQAPNSRLGDHNSCRLMQLPPCTPGNLGSRQCEASCLLNMCCAQVQHQHDYLPSIYVICCSPAQ